MGPVKGYAPVRVGSGETPGGLRVLHSSSAVRRRPWSGTEASATPRRSSMGWRERHRQPRRRLLRCWRRLEGLEQERGTTGVTQLAFRPRAPPDFADS